MAEQAGGRTEIPVDVVRSARRRKTVEARIVDNRIRLLIPARLTKSEEQHWITTMRRRLTPAADAAAIDLAPRARRLARRYGLPEPTSIRWVDNQKQRWGSCTPADGTVRISTQLSAYPKWVIDAVVVHELAHLIEPGHGPAFRALVARHPMTERATGFLIAKGLAEDDVAGAIGPPEVDMPGIDEGDAAQAAHLPDTLF